MSIFFVGNLIGKTFLVVPDTVGVTLGVSFFTGSTFGDVFLKKSKNPIPITSCIYVSDLDTLLFLSARWRYITV